MQNLVLSLETEDKIKSIIRNLISHYSSKDCSQKEFSTYFLSQIGLSSYLENFHNEVKTYMDFSKIKFETLCNKAKILNAAASSIILFRDYYLEEYKKFKLCRKIYKEINKSYEDYVCEDFTNIILPKLNFSELIDYFGKILIILKKDFLESCNMSSETLKEYQKTDLIKESSLSKSRGNLIWDYLFYLSCPEIKKNFNKSKETGKKYDNNIKESKEKKTNKSYINNDDEEIKSENATKPTIKSKKSDDEESNDEETKNKKNKEKERKTQETLKFNTIINNDENSKKTDKKNFLISLTDKNNPSEQIIIVDKKEIHSKSKIKTEEETTIKYDYSIVFIEEFIFLKVGNESLLKPYIQLKENKITLRNSMAFLINEILIKIIKIDIKKKKSKISFLINKEKNELIFEDNDLILISDGFAKMNKTNKRKEKYGTTEIIDDQLIINFTESIKENIWIEINNKNNYFPLQTQDYFKIEASAYYVTVDTKKFKTFEENECYTEKCQNKSNKLLEFYPCKHKFICKDCHKKKYKEKINEILFCYVCKERFGFFKEKKN